jgi:flagellum-specific peptidoglycan hydrolase FlgJ
MAFKDVLKKQRQSGKGLISSLGSSAFDTIREKIDYRNSLFKKGGTLNALFPNVKGFKAGETLKVPKQAKTETEKTIVSMDNTEVVQQLSQVSSKLDIVGKNTMVLPIMMRDMNVMRQGIVKLVKLSGGTQRDKADRFFQTSTERESLYETKIAKSKIVTPTTPTNVKQVPEEKKKGIFDSILDFLPTIFKGLLLTGIIGQLLENEETRKKVKDFVSLVLTKFFNGVSNSFEVIKESFQNEDVQKSIRTAIGSIISTIGEFLSIKLTKLFDTPFGEVNLTIGGAIAAVIAGFVAFKVAIATLTEAVLKAAGRMAVGGAAGAAGAGGKGGKGGRGGWLRGLGTAFGIGVIGKGIQYYLEQGESEEDARKLAQEDIDKQKLGLDPGEEIVSPLRKPEGMRGSEIAERATSAAVGASLLKSGLSGLPSTPSTTPSTTPSSKVSDPFAKFEGKKLTSGGSVRENREIEKNKPLYEKIVKVMKKAWEKGVSTTMLSKLYSKFGIAVFTKLSLAIGGIVAAGPSVGISLLITALGVGLLAKDVYDLYEWFVEYEKELDAYEKSSSPSPTPMTANIENPVDAMGNVTGYPSSPPTAVQGRSTMKNDPRRADKAPSNSPTPSSSTSSPVAAYGGYKSRQDFTDAMMPYAQKAATELKVSPEAIIAQWGLETGFGRAGAIQGQFNYGNIQGTYRESEPGLDSGRARNFIKYNSMDDFVDDYIKQLKNPRYAKQGIGQEQLGDREFFTALKKGGYAEDPNYVNTLTALAEKQRGIKPGAPGQVPTYEKPATAVAQAPSVPTRPAAQIASASTSLADTMRTQMQTPVVINTATTNNNVQNASNGGQRATTTPSIVDSELMKLLVERVAA